MQLSKGQQPFHFVVGSIGFPMDEFQLASLSRVLYAIGQRQSLTQWACRVNRKKKSGCRTRTIASVSHVEETDAGRCKVTHQRPRTREMLIWDICGALSAANFTSAPRKPGDVPALPWNYKAKACWFLRLCPNVITFPLLQMHIMTFMVTHTKYFHKENESGCDWFLPPAAVTSRPRLAQGEMKRGANVAGSFLTAELVSHLWSQFLQLSVPWQTPG